MVYTSAAVERGLARAVRAPGFVVHNGVDPDRFDQPLTMAMKGLENSI